MNPRPRSKHAEVIAEKLKPLIRAGVHAALRAKARKQAREAAQ